MLCMAVIVYFSFLIAVGKFLQLLLRWFYFMRRSKLRFWLFLAPALISFTIICVIPMLIGFYFSFTDWDGVNMNPTVVGFYNFVRMFTSDFDFLRALLFTAVVAVVTIILVNVFGLALAMFVMQKFKGANLLRSVLFMPNLIGGLLLGFTWNFIFTNVFSSIGTALNLEFLKGWLSNTETGFIGIIILNVWQMSGYMMIIYIAQLQHIPSSVKEAAKIDGANWWQTFRSVTFPLVMPAFTIGLFLSISNSFKMFDQNLALTKGGPYHSTEMLALNIYNSAFSANEYGYAQAKAIIFLIVVAGIGLIQLVATKKKEVEM